MSSAQTDHQDISRFFITARLKLLHMNAPFDCVLPNAEAVHARTYIKKLEASELLSVSYTMTCIEIRHLDPSISLSTTIAEYTNIHSLFHIALQHQRITLMSQSSLMLRPCNMVSSPAIILPADILLPVS